ncbi:MAG: (d)CMP kinase [Actinomycetes bacterium]
MTTAAPPATDVASLVVAVDGPSGAGKSTVSRAVASRLGLRYLDTGAMYRAMAWWMLEHGVDVHDPKAVTGTASRPLITAGTDPAGPTIQVDGVDVAGSIRTRAVSVAVSPVAAVPAVRVRMVAIQRKLIGTGGIVVEGRDIGTVVAPDASVKVFLTADQGARVRRRTGELAHDPAVTIATTESELARRDAIDSSRAASPLIKAADAIEVDTTALTLNEVVEAVLRLVKERAGVG